MNYTTWSKEKLNELQKQGIIKEYDKIKLNKYNGRWYIANIYKFRNKYYLELEHTFYGDETFHLIVTDKYNVVCETWNGFQEYLDIRESTTKEDEKYYNGEYDIYTYELYQKEKDNN